jgi:hypothetical protein
MRTATKRKFMTRPNKAKRPKRESPPIRVTGTALGGGLIPYIQGCERYSLLNRVLLAGDVLIIPINGSRVPGKLGFLSGYIYQGHSIWRKLSLRYAVSGGVKKATYAGINNELAMRFLDLVLQIRSLAGSEAIWGDKEYKIRLQFDAKTKKGQADEIQPQSYKTKIAPGSVHLPEPERPKPKQRPRLVQTSLIFMPPQLKQSSQLEILQGKVHEQPPFELVAVAPAVLQGKKRRVHRKSNHKAAKRTAHEKQPRIPGF